MTEEEVARHAALETLVICLLATLANRVPDGGGLLDQIEADANGAVDRAVIQGDDDANVARVRRLMHREIARIARSVESPGRRSPMS